MLNEAASKIERSQSVNVTCAITADGQTTPARLTMSGARFVMQSAPMAVWFDGRTQWTWSAATNEVNITEPTPQELAVINPLSLIASLRKGYHVSVVRTTSTTKTLRLTPRTDSGDIASAEITLKTASLEPKEIKIVYSSGAKMVITVNSFTVGKKLPDSSFRYSATLHPDAEIIDLR